MSKTVSKRVKQPVRKEPESPEEALALKLEEFTKWHRDYHVPYPPQNRILSTGQRVMMNLHTEAVVVDVLDNGRVLQVSYHDKGRRNGDDYDHGWVPKFVHWIDVAPLEAIQADQFFRERLRTDYMQQNIGILLRRVYSRGLWDSPDYQRGYVWTLEDKQRLIRSIFDRADIGKFVFIEDPVRNELEVVDGKQRLRAIMDYYEDRFTYEGVFYSQLSFRDKHAFQDLNLQTAELKRENVKRSDILWLFLQLNAGGVPQTEEHIAQARELYTQAVAEENKAS